MVKGRVRISPGLWSNLSMHCQSEAFFTLMSRRPHTDLTLLQYSLIGDQRVGMPWLTLLCWLFVS
jgi:hypothetical protein